MSYADNEKITEFYYRKIMLILCKSHNILNAIVVIKRKV